VNAVERTALAMAYLQLTPRALGGRSSREEPRDTLASAVVLGWIGDALNGEALTHEAALVWANATVGKAEHESAQQGDSYLDVMQRAWRAVIPEAEKVPFAEVYRLLERVGQGELTPRLGPGQRPWKESGWHVHFVVGDYELWVFNDCDAWDYIDDLRAADGRTASFFDWLLDGPEQRLARDKPRLYRRMVRAFVRAQ
jgi:hypothetical protein